MNRMLMTRKKRRNLSMPMSNCIQYITEQKKLFALRTDKIVKSGTDNIEMCFTEKEIKKKISRQRREARISKIPCDQWPL
jgi:hypothetical protein